MAPLAGEARWTLLLLWPAEFFGASYIGVLAVAMVVITPNQMRGQVTAVYISVTNMLGLTVGASALAAFTDFVYRDEGLLHYSIATVNGLLYSIAAVLFWFCLPAYRRAEGESGRWDLSTGGI